jgi:hypothetical protein
MIYRVHIVGSFETKKFEAATPADAAAAFGREVNLPQSGWILVEGNDWTIKQYAVSDVPVGHEDNVALQAGDSATRLKPILVDSGVDRPRFGKLILPTFLVSGLALFVWPFVAFGTVFIFDAPFRSSLDKFIRDSATASILAYPGVWFLALTVAVVAKTEPKWKLLFVAALIAPFLWIGLAIALLNAWGNLAR